MPKKKTSKRTRLNDPYIDRRSGEDRREVYYADYFESGGNERRELRERRQNKERREGCVRVSKWSSVCPGDM